MATTLPSPATPMAARIQAPPEDRRATPIKWWSAAGVGVLLVMAYTYSSWILSGDAVRTPKGADPVPGWMAVTLKTWEVVGVLALVAAIWWLVVRPWRREGRLTTDGALVIAYTTLHFQDPLLNYTQVWSTYNASFVNWGNWAAHLPGWVSPTGGLFAEPIIWTMPAYVYAVVIAVRLVNLVMHKVKARWPQTGPLGLVGAAFAFSMVFDFALESAFMRIGIYTYPGSIESVTIFRGHYYQFPLYEVIFGGAMFTAFACLRYFQDDRGRTIAERGIDSLELPSKRLNTVRVTAMIGFLHVMFLVTYNIPIQMIAIHSGPWPEDITERSYFMNQMCGEGTDYACGGPDVPLPLPTSAHVGPDGTLRAP